VTTQASTGLVNHCGGCDISCLALSFPNAQPLCDTSGAVPLCDYGCAAGFVDVDGAAANGCECQPKPGVDHPDPLGIDSNCDGIDGDKSSGVFVSKAGDDAAPGSFEAPKRSIQAAIDAAKTGGKTSVFVATGLYVESLLLADGGERLRRLQRDVHGARRHRLPDGAAGRAADGRPARRGQRRRGRAGAR
jgi:hypothetical protein